MSEYKHLLLATDLSEDADLLVKTALSVSEKTQGKLSIVHVLEHTPIIYGGGDFSIPIDMNLEEQLAHNARQALELLASKANIPLENQYVAHGSIKREIIDLADKLKINLIIIGRHGHSGIGKFMGSTANAILHAAKCDVLAVNIKPPNL